MAHCIDFTTGKAGIAYVGETPWHGLGTEMPENASIADWRKAAGLDWQANKAPIHFDARIVEDGHAKTVEQIADDRVALYRDDTGGLLGVFSKRYQPVQPAEVLDFYRTLCEHHDFEMETAGALKDGRIIWALARTGEQARVKGNDVVNGYVLLSTSYDGSMATTARHTSVRVVCNNTLQMAAGKHAGTAAFTVRHNTTFDAAKARDALGIGEGFKEFQAKIEALSDARMSPKQAVEFFMSVYHDIGAEQKAALTEKEDKTVEKTVERLVNQYLNGPGAKLASADGTAWGLVNAVTHDVDFEVRARSNENRLASAWYGNGAKLKEKAWAKAVELAAA